MNNELKDRKSIENNYGDIVYEDHSLIPSRDELIKEAQERIIQRETHMGLLKNGLIEDVIPEIPFPSLPVPDKDAVWISPYTGKVHNYWNKIDEDK